MTTQIIHIADLIDWITAIPFDEWPQQRPIDASLRPAMVNDLSWHDFGPRTDRLVAALLTRFPGCVARTRMLSCVMPGHSIPVHTDDQAPTWVCRLHVPLVTNDRAYFIDEAGDRTHVESDSVHQVNTRLPHGVVNEGSTPRIHFMVDVHTA